jgi:membrane protein implicated in regulation of membrane protease activity
MELLAWYNLIFVAPIGLAGVYLILSATGLAGDHDVDSGVDHDVDMDHDVDLSVDHDVDVDMDHDVDLSVDHDVDVDMDHDIHADMDHDVEHDLDAHVGHGDVHHGGVEHEVHDHHVSAHAGNSFALRALSVLGLGKVPVSILFTTMMVLFGATGLACNGLFGSVFPWGWAPNVYVWPSLGVAVLLSLTLTGSIAQLLNRIMPTSETYAIREDDLVGRIGELLYAVPAGQRGMADVKDEGGTWHRIRVQPLEGDLPKGTDIIVVRYHREGDYFDVSQSPL